MDTIKAKLLSILQALKLIRMNPGEHIYQVAKDHIGLHLTLDQSVSSFTGCAEAVSKVLQLAGYYVPKLGIAGTADLDAFLQNNRACSRVTTPLRGDVCVYSTGEPGSAFPHGHCFIIGDTYDMSNDSFTGLFSANYTHAQRIQYFEVEGRFTPHYYRFII